MAENIKHVSIKNPRWLPGEKPPTIMQPNHYFFYCKHCKSATMAEIWNAKYCQREACQKAKGKALQVRKAGYNKKRKAIKKSEIERKIVKDHDKTS